MSNANDFIIENGVLTKYVGPGGDVVVLDGITEIGAWAFCECATLTTITIPESVTAIGEYAFFMCKSLAVVRILGSNISIHNNAFHCCSGVDFYVSNTSLLPAKLRIDAALSFAKDGGKRSDPRSESHCKYIKSNVGKIIDTAVANPALLSLMCREKLISAKLVPEYMEAAQKCGNAECIAQLMDYSANKLTSGEKSRASKQKETDTDTVIDRKIRRMEKKGIDGLVFVVTGDLDTFPNRSELKRFITEKGGKLAGSMSAKVDYLIMNNDAYDSEKKKKAEELGIDIITEQLLNEKAERHFYINNKGVLVSYLGPGGDVVIPEGVTEIGHRAFWGRSTLKTVAIPDSVTEIGSCAFWECKSLISVSVPEGVTKISDYTFCSCNALASVFLPESIKSIHKTAFNGCNSSFKIHAPVGSYAEAYAKKNKIPFVAE